VVASSIGLDVGRDVHKGSQEGCPQGITGGTTSRAMAQGGGCCAGLQQQSHPRKDHGGQPGSNRKAAGSEGRGPNMSLNAIVHDSLLALTLGQPISKHPTAPLP
jgi:hypothetical protein